MTDKLALLREDPRMDFVNQAYGQLLELFRSMSVGTRIATALLLALVVVSLVVSVSVSGNRRR